MNVVDKLLVYGISVKKFTRTADTIIKKMGAESKKIEGGHRQIAYSDDRKHKLYCKRCWNDDSPDMLQFCTVAQLKFSNNKTCCELEVLQLFPHNVNCTQKAHCTKRAMMEKEMHGRGWMLLPFPEEHIVGGFADGMMAEIVRRFGREESHLGMFKLHIIGMLILNS